MTTAKEIIERIEAEVAEGERFGIPAQFALLIQTGGGIAAVTTGDDPKYLEDAITTWWNVLRPDRETTMIQEPQGPWPKQETTMADRDTTERLSSQPSGPVNTLKPSVGRIVLVPRRLDSPLEGLAPAIITEVWGDDCINLQVFHDFKQPETRTSQSFRLEQWIWPPRV